MNSDPKGYYGVLGLNPSASPTAIAGAFRRQAKILHPDVPRTGDAARFVRLREAYDVLGQPDRRAAYDRSAKSTQVSSLMPAGAHGARERPERGSSPPAALGAGLAALLIAVAAQGFWLLGGARHDRPAAVPSSSIPLGEPSPAGVDADPGPSAAPGGAVGALTDFVLPAPGDAILWRYDRGRRSYVPAGRLAPFASVEMLRAVPDSAMEEIRAADGRVGFVEAASLAPGTPAAAHLAACTFDAGTPPRNGEVLRRGATGAGEVRVNNQEDQPVVVQLRDLEGTLVAEMFIGPRQTATLDGVPTGLFLPQYASGEFWSRSCGIFTAAMRGQRFGQPIRIDEAAGRAGLDADIVVPSRDPVLDISDEDFSRR